MWIHIGVVWGDRGPKNVEYDSRREVPFALFSVDKGDTDD